MKTLKFVFLLILSGCASQGAPRQEAVRSEKPTEISVVPFADFVKSADVSAEKRAVSPYAVSGKLRGDGFGISKAYVTDTNDSAYYFDDDACVSKSFLAAQLNGLGYTENTDRLPNSERSLDSYAIYSKPKAQINAEFSIKEHSQCLWVLFIKYKQPN